MSREIKFRVWNSAINRFDDNYVIRPNGVLAPIFGLCMDGRSYPLGTEIIIEQFTGIKDKNGKEIYEGDIVENLDAVKFEIILSGTRFIAKFFDKNKGRYVEANLLGSNGKLLIVGNIHENKELIKE